MSDLVFNPGDWYWFISGDQTQAFSSKTNAFVPVDDPTFAAWPGVATSIDTLDNLKAVLADACVPPYAPVTPRQARLALLGAGLLDQVEAAVTAAGGATQITWEYATQILRDDPLILQIGASLGLTQAQIDALFITAAGL